MWQAGVFTRTSLPDARTSLPDADAECGKVAVFTRTSLPDATRKPEQGRRGPFVDEDSLAVCGRGVVAVSRLVSHFYKVVRRLT